MATRLGGGEGELAGNCVSFCCPLKISYFIICLTITVRMESEGQEDGVRRWEVMRKGGGGARTEGFRDEDDAQRAAKEVVFAFLIDGAMA